MEVLNIADRKQLFIDDMLIADRSNVRRVVNRPALADPVLEPGPEGSYNDAFVGVMPGQVIRDGDVYRMWVRGASARVLTMPWDAPELKLQPTGYAESNDGIRWETPNLGLFEWGGSKANNIVFLDWGCVFRDPHPRSEQERYKALVSGYYELGKRDGFENWDSEQGGLFFYTSADGIRWTWSPRQILSVSPDCVNQIMYDTRIGKYVAYIRCWPNRHMRGRNHGRAVARLEMEDPMEAWPVPAIKNPWRPYGAGKIVVPSTEYPVVMSYPDYEKDGHWTDIYDPNVIQYPWAEDVYFAFPELNYHKHESPIDNHSTLEIGMCVSRDGIEWDWPSLEAYIPFGPKGSSRSGMLYNVMGMIREGDEIFQYHFGTDAQHHDSLDKDPGYAGVLNSGRVYRTVQRLDGFVSVDFAGDGGELITPPFTFAGEKLLLNIDASKGAGSIEILRADGMPVPGYTLDDCREIDRDMVEHPVVWKGSEGLQKLQGATIRLRLRMRDCKLCALRFC